MILVGYNNRENILNPYIQGKVLSLYTDSYTKEMYMDCIIGDTPNTIPIGEKTLETLKDFIK